MQFDQLKRREFITLLGGAAAALPLAAGAQPATMPVIGFLHPTSLESFAENLRGFRQGLKETGYVEGENVAFEFRWADAQLDRLPELAADLVRRRVAVIVTASPPAAFAAYLNVLRATQPTHFAYFARQHLDAPSMQPKLQQALATRDAEIARLIAAGNWLVAKQVATDRILLSSSNHVEELKRLAAIYQHLPEYANILNLHPEAFPTFPLANPDRASLLMAMGFYDEAADNITHRYPLRPLKSALTQSLALNRGNASKESIFAIEVLMNSVPRDYVPELLPLTVRGLALGPAPPRLVSSCTQCLRANERGR